MDTGSAAADASGDDLSLGDEVLNTYKDSNITGEKVFAEIENLPMQHQFLRLPPMTTYTTPYATTWMRMQPLILLQEALLGKNNVHSIMYDDWEAKSVIIFNSLPHRHHEPRRIL